MNQKASEPKNDDDDTTAAEAAAEQPEEDASKSEERNPETISEPVSEEAKVAPPAVANEDDALADLNAQLKSLLM